MNWKRRWTTPGCGLLPQVRQYREHAEVVVSARRQSELLEDAGDVLFDCSERDIARVGDRLIRAALRHEGEHLPLDHRQGGQRVVPPAPAHEFRDDGRVEDGAACADALQRVGQLRDVGDAILQQIADARGVLGDQLHRVGGLDMLGEDEHADLGARHADLLGRAQPLVGVRRRQADVYDDRVGRPQVDLAHQILPGLALTDDLESCLLQEAGQALPEQDDVLGDHDAHGISTVSTVPAPGGLLRRTRPPSASTRSMIPRSPLPVPTSAPPRPSSVTPTPRLPPLSRTSTRTNVASACLAAFVTASDTAKYAATSTCSGSREGRSTTISVAIGDLAARASSAASRPRLVRRAGWMPL